MSRSDAPNDAAPGAVPTGPGAVPPERAWWQDALIYQVYPRSFADGNGDGVGDLWGLIDRLDHLESLGVDAVWMSPCYPSPQHDHGYDVADYFDINPDYGSLEVFDELVRRARERGIRIMLDVVPNHCSIEHPWFRAALAAPPHSPERARFWFRDGRGVHGEEPPNNWSSIFGGPAWTRVTEPDGTPGQWYLHVFDSSQPDFNWENEEVAEHFEDMFTFWFDRGVEGFRFDAVTVVGKADGLPDAPEAPPGTRATEVGLGNPHFLMKARAHGYWRRLRRHIDDYERGHPGRRIVTISEAYTPLRPDVLLRFVAPDQFHQSFAFDLMLSPWDAPFVRSVVDDTIGVLAGAGANLSWTLNNHDTHRAVTRYGRADAHMRSSWTGNNLVHSEAPVDAALGTVRARAMIGFAAGLPGALYMYQGEELGLPEWLDLPDHRRQDPIHRRTAGAERGRDGCRVPLPWTTATAGNFGFSRIVPGATGSIPTGSAGVNDSAPEAWLPQPTWWGEYGADAQEGDPDSMLTMYRALMAARRTIASGAGFEWVNVGSAGVDDTAVLAFRRGPADVPGNTLVVMNMSAGAVSLPETLVRGARMVFTSATRPGATAPQSGLSGARPSSYKASITDVGPYTTVWYQR